MPFVLGSFIGCTLFTRFAMAMTLGALRGVADVWALTEPPAPETNVVSLDDERRRRYVA